MTQEEKEREIVIYKSDGHPDQLTDNLTSVATDAMEKYFDEIYFRLDNCYLKARDFPEFYIGGNIAFDLREYGKDDRHQMEAYVRDRIVNEFKSVFSSAFLNIRFNLSFSLSEDQRILSEGGDVEKVFLYKDERNTPVRDKMYSVISILNQNRNPILGEDVELIVSNNTVYIGQVFREKDENKILEIKENISKEILNTIPDVNEVEYRVAGVNRFGSRIFRHKSSVSGRGNGLDGFISSITPSNPYNYISGIPSYHTIRKVLERDPIVIEDGLFQYSNIN